MAQLRGHPEVFGIDTASEDSSQNFPLGTRGADANGNEFIYLQGTASVTAGQWVVVRPSWSTSRAVADDEGMLAIAGTAVATGEYGWFQIYGRNTGAGNSGAVAANAALYLTANAGYVDDADVAGDAIAGAVAQVANTGSAFTVWIAYPFAHDIAFD